MAVVWAAFSGICSRAATVGDRPSVAGRSVRKLSPTCPTVISGSGTTRKVAVWGFSGLFAVDVVADGLRCVASYGRNLSQHKRIRMRRKQGGRSAFLRATGLGLFVSASISASSAQELAAPEPAEPSAADSLTSAPSGNSADDVLNLVDKPLENLVTQSVVTTAPAAMAMPVTTVTRTESTVAKSPAAIFVITNEMIRRSGARSSPEVLRLAPGVHVARIDGSRYAIGIRGSNNQFADKLLVQIDGRSVYSPLFAGTYWDVQDVLLEDVERIEIIRGPGATVWGANAVNGIINVITKSSKDTIGTFAEAGAGSEEHGFASARVGGLLGAGATYRVYGKWFDRDGGFDPNGFVEDDMTQGRGGMRFDWEATDSDTFTVIADAYGGVSDITAIRPAFPPVNGLFVAQSRFAERVHGGNVLARWRRELSEDSDWRIQAYYDRTVRDQTWGGYRAEVDTVDIDFQHRFVTHTPRQHDIIWGFGYRNNRDKLRAAPFWIEWEDERRATDIFSYFVQDQIELSEDLWYLTLGSKFEHNDYTNFEYQPSVRLLYTPTERQSVWAAVSRAVRTPARVNEDIILTVPTSPTQPVFGRLLGVEGVDSEDLLAYEIGMRTQQTERWFWDVAAFYYQYENLFAGVPQAPIIGAPVLVPTLLVNSLDAHAYGFEVASDYKVSEQWMLRGGYTFMRFVFDSTPLALDASTFEYEGSSPRNQLFLQSSWDLGCAWELDLAWRYVDTLPAFGVPSYNALDARLAWAATQNLEIAVVGRQLLDDHHLEFPASAYIGGMGTEVQHEVYGVVTWRY
jgi:iron complex outermembrane receptor protein